ncbi:Translation initiation factor 3 subunit b, partial [Marasmius sp. AFHP31]
MSTSAGDNIDDIDYSDIEAKYRVEYDDSFDNTLLIDGVPIIDKSKLEKLLAKICKEFSRKGAPIKPDDIFMPWDDSTGKNKGYLFVDFRNADEANIALTAMHDHPFDSRHTFKVNRFTDVEKYAQIDETYIEPEDEEFVPK